MIASNFSSRLTLERIL